jgi:3'-phosphoadenosine 5'-phosphosulfate (PAPS) 3'-phosphatase
MSRFVWIIPLFILVGAYLSANALPPEISNHEWAERLSHALEMGREAGQAILRVKASKNLQTEIKADQTPVTKADRASNETICHLINQLYPDDGVLSEETITGEKALNDAIEKGIHAEYTWVIDP